MTREIKFRGKRINNGQWVYGGYHKHTKRQVCPVGDDKLKDEDICHVIVQSGFADWNMPKPLEAIEVDPKTIGQFTGLKDKSGQEIYEGDVVKYGDTIHEVVFEQRNNTAYFGLTYSPEETRSFGHYQDLQQIEIIGNIYENPELLGV